MLKKKINKPKQIIGKRILVDFPELDISGIVAKIDTGTYTNTLHCYNFYTKKENGKKILCFQVLDPTHSTFNEQEHCFSEFKKKKIKNSFGEVEERYVIKTKIRIAGRMIKSIISLTDRADMRYPVLIGRRLLKKKFIVDVAEINIYD
ncbi:MAG: RimK/LysX family protein [Bacteroidota bacterium]